MESWDALKITYIKGFTGAATLYTSVRQETESNPEYSYGVKGSIYKSRKT